MAVPLAAWLTTLASCGAGRAETSARIYGPGDAVRPEAAAAGPLAHISRQLVRRGRMDVEVVRLSAAQARLERALGTLGGRVAYLQTREDERAEYNLRVPADRLDALMDSVASLGEVETRTVSATDVTEQVVDAEARLSALRASRDRLRQLLERASTVQDVVTVERELARVQGELESLEGRLNALRGQVALSELSVSLRRRPVLGPLGLLLQGLGTLVAKLFVIR
jgi:hypothetical protein